MCSAQAGPRYTSLSTVRSRYGFPAPSERGGTVTFKSQYTTLEFENDSRKLFVNGLLVWFNAPVTGGRGGLQLNEQDVARVLDPLLRSRTALASAGYRTVVLDPGHGGDDEGSRSPRNVIEKKVTLDLARRVQDKLRKSRVTVRLTRSTDSYISLTRRTALADKWGADVFVSIHMNAAASRSAGGLETFVLTSPGFASTSSTVPERKSYRGNKYDKANAVLGYFMQRGLTSRVQGDDRGVKRARFQVLRDAGCPAALVECGFLSNKAEETAIIDPSHRDKVADGLAQGILTYLGRVRDAGSR
jgi:N-acetylmuramoyl-L-alanine amidase